MSREIEQITGPRVGLHRQRRPHVRERDPRPTTGARSSAQSSRPVERHAPFTLDYRVLHADGTIRWVHEQGRGATDEHGEMTLLDGAIFDITARKQLEEELAHLAFHDALTGLPNRAMLAEHARARPRAVAPGGTQRRRPLRRPRRLQARQRRLRPRGGRRAAARRRRPAPARRPRDRHSSPGRAATSSCSCSPTSTPPRRAAVDHAIALAERVLRQALARPVVVAGVEVYASASIGIAVFPGDAERRGRRSSSAPTSRCTARKQRGRDGARSSPADPRADADAAALRWPAACAAPSSCDEFELHYQPLVALATGAMLGVEALIRWHDPDRGLIVPDEFIPLAERTGRSRAISDWVRRTRPAGSRARGAADGLELYVSVNLPPRFWRPTAMRRRCSRIDRVVRDRPGAPDARDHRVGRHGPTPTATRRSSTTLHDRGVRVAIDDFGTGHSSLARLHQLAIDDAEDRPLVHPRPARAVGGRARVGDHRARAQPRPRPLAEGIETEDQRRFLLEHGCELGQGFLFSRALPAALVPAYRSPVAGGALAA